MPSGETHRRHAFRPYMKRISSVCRVGPSTEERTNWSSGHYWSGATAFLEACQNPTNGRFRTVSCGRFSSTWCNARRCSKIKRFRQYIASPLCFRVLSVGDNEGILKDSKKITKLIQCIASTSCRVQTERDDEETMKERQKISKLPS